MMKFSAVGVVSLGCSKNLVDTERMLGLLTDAGFTIVSDPKQAEILIVNTCGFIESAKQESIDTILEMAQHKLTACCKKLIVTGCLSQRYKAQLEDELPEVDLFLGVNEYERLLPFLNGEPQNKKPPRVLATPSYSAYLRVGDGCSNRCAYCAIPLIRGGIKSEPLETLVEEAERLAAGGVVELTLIAQDTSGYGTDLYGKPMLMPLLKRLSDIPEIEWLRVLYTYPDTVTPELVEFISGNEKVCNYLDMPLQHCNDEILKRMHRRGDRAHIERVLAYIRKYAPDFMLRTTMMVGFPGETDAQFEEMLAFLKDNPFDRLGAFAFSPEEDTPAALMPDQVPENVKAERLEALMLQQRGIAKAKNEARLNKTYKLLVEGTNNGRTFGRTWAEAPDVDGKFFIPAKANHRPGMFLNVRAITALEYDLIGEQI
ncbi:30S ribosomal protein S12 methylthiotransferase RimO [Eubacteriales bacterium OttesenSCG-928-K08]|nr:30S ribosomal protein S12 methylthiotransferase RimO [Eubacteriales bacterium OttesenSCG-928-K08]